MKKLSKITIATAISALAICAVSISASAVDRTFSSSGTLYVTEEDEIIEATCIQISNMTVGGLYELAPTDIVSATISAANEEDTSAWSVEFDSYSTDWSGWTGPASEPGVLELTATVQEMMDAIEVDDISEFGGFVLYVRNCQEGDEINWTISIEPGIAVDVPVEPDVPDEPVPEEPTVPDVPEEPEDPVDPVEKDIDLLSSGSSYLDGSTVRTSIYNEWSSQSDAIIVDSDDFVNVGSISVRIKVSDMSKPFNVWICYADYNWEYVYWEEDDEGNLNASSDTVLINGDGYYVINLSIDGYPSGLAYMAVYTDLESDVDDIPSITVDAIRVNGVLEDTDGETKIEVKYEYTELSDGTLEITGCNGAAANIVIPTEIDGKKVTKIGDYAFSELSITESITIPDGVTHIGWYAFSDSSSLTSVTIPDSVTTIGPYAFYYCEKLTSVTIPEGITSIKESTFECCGSLTSVNIPESVKSIEWCAFFNCSSLASVTIPDSVTSLGTYSFYGCSSLETITIPDSVTYIGTYAFSGCSSLTSVTIPAGVTEMGGRVFAECTSLKSINVDSGNEYYVSENGVLFDKEKTTLIAYPPKKTGTSYTIPNTVTNISDSAFVGCSSLSKIDIPDTVTYIGDTAFSGCSSLKSVTIPDGVTKIGCSAFSDCNMLSTVNISEGVTSIGSDAFAWCYELEAIDIPDSVESIGYDAFYGTPLLDNQTTDVKYADTWVIGYSYEAESVTIKDGTTGIADNALSGCITTSITIPDSVKYIGEYAFSGSSLESVIIPEDVTIIKVGTFYYCTSLESVSIPDGVKEIESEAFYECSSLETINIPAGITYIGWDAFEGCSLTDVSFVKHTLGHEIAYENGITTEGYLSTSENEDGTLTIEGFTGNETSIVIPSEINGKKVTAIHYLSGTHPNVTTVTIPASVVDIYLYILQNMELKSISVNSSNKYYSSADGILFNKEKTELILYPSGKTSTSYTVPDGVTKISNSAFSNCASLEEINIPASVTAIGILTEENENGYFDVGHTFGGCTSLTAINVDTDNADYESSDGLLYSKNKSILYVCPEGRSGIVNVADGTKKLSTIAFNKCANVTVVNIPASLTNIGLGFKPYANDAFVDSGVKAINVDEDNSVYASIDGIVYSKDKKDVITCPPGYVGEVNIADGTVNILTEAFYGCTGITKVTFPSTLKYIYYYSFWGCSSLTAVDIPEGVKEIGTAAFFQCGNLADISLPSTLYYLGYRAFHGTAAYNSQEDIVVIDKWLVGGSGSEIPNDIIGISGGGNVPPLGDNGTFYFTGKDLVLPEGLLYINNCALMDVYNERLKSITIPKSVINIGDILKLDRYNEEYKENIINNLTIYCYKGTAGEEFAIKYGLKYELIKAAPSAVTGFKSPSKSTTAIRLNWDKNDDATGYIIEQYNGSKWVQIADITDNTTVTYKVTGLKPGTAYKFRMKAYNDSGASAYTATLTVNTQMTAVKGFKSPSKSTTAIRLGWTKNAYATGYIVEQYDGKSWVQIADITDNATVTYKVTGLVPGTAYKFRMKAYSVTKYGETIYGDKTATLTINTQMTAVKDFAGTSKSTSSIDLSWTKNAYADGYIIEQYDGSAWTQIADITDPATVTYKVTGLKSGTAYKFRMKAYSITKYDETIYGDKTATLTVNTRASAVKDFALKSRSSTALRLKWTKNTAVDGYIIEQYIDGQWVQIVEIEGNATTEYKVTGLKASTKYKFRMKSYVVTKYGDKTYSAYTSVLTKTTNPSNVSGLTVKSKAQTAIRLAWSKNTSATGYCIEQYKDGKWVQVAKIESNATLNYRIDGLTKATTYKFRVRAYNIVGTTTLYSDYKTISATTNS